LPPIAAQSQNRNLLAASSRPEVECTALSVFGGGSRARRGLGGEGFNAFIPTVTVRHNFTMSSEGDLGLYILDRCTPGRRCHELATCSFSRSRIPSRQYLRRNWRYEKSRNLWASRSWVNKDILLPGLTMKQLDRFWLPAHRRMGGISTQQIRKAGIGEHSHLGRGSLDGEWASKPIRHTAIVAPGFEIAVERKLFHWSDKLERETRELSRKARYPALKAKRSQRAQSRLFQVSMVLPGGRFFTPRTPGRQTDHLSEDGGPYVPLHGCQNRAYP